jgi:hypothetical protein
MRRTLTALILIAAVLPAFAAEAPAADSKDASKADAKGGKPGTNVDMPYVMAPMTDADGKLVGYAYISGRLTATSDVNALAIRNKLAFIQDAFVRDVNGARVAKADDGTTLDQPALEARLVADAKRVMGAGAIASIALVQVQIAPLHPTQNPSPNAVPPQPDPAAKPTQTAKSGG